MRNATDPKSPWGKRLWYDNSEFEALMDDQRARIGTQGFQRGRGVDIEAILEQVHGITPDYVQLEPGVLGRTIFGRRGEIRIEIARELSEAAERSRVDRRRVRSTIGHELAHVVLHCDLFAVDMLTGSLFPDVPVHEPIACRDVSYDQRPASGAGYDGRWWEYQANQGMANILLPRSLLREVLPIVLRETGCATIEDALERHRAVAAIRGLAEAFDVNPQMCVLRLQDLDLLPRNVNQNTLALSSEEE